MKVLVTGGLGFIGSHTCVELIDAGYEVVIVDNLYNSSVKILDYINEIAKVNVPFYEVDCCDELGMDKVFKDEQNIEAAIHFAGYKAVGESVEKPLMYYENNLVSTFVLCKIMHKYNCKNLVFSSSATVYGTPKSVPIFEDFKVGPTTNPYGATKLMIEQILNDLWVSDNNLNMMILRYFNPVGGHSSGKLGEKPNGIPNNLMPYIVKVAEKEMPFLRVYGSDYDTHDGSGVRDYIHVVDLAKGHVSALKYMDGKHCVETINLGTGVGYSVIDVAKTFERVNGIAIPYQIEGRRAGDIGTCFASTKKAYELLGWKAEKNLEDMCRDAYNFSKFIKSNSGN